MPVLIDDPHTQRAAHTLYIVHPEPHVRPAQFILPPTPAHVRVARIILFLKLLKFKEINDNDTLVISIYIILLKYHHFLRLVKVYSEKKIQF